MHISQCSFHPAERGSLLVMMRTIALSIIVYSLGLFMTCSWARADEVSFHEHIAPLLVQKCVACHNGKKAEGGYRVDTYTQLMKEGDSAAAPVEAGEPSQSELVRRIASTDESERMPLDAAPLTTEQISLVRAWIASGASCEEALRERPLASIVPAASYAAAPKAYAYPLPITALAFTADGSQLLVSGYHEVTVWSIPEGKLVRRLGNVGQRTYSLAAHPHAMQLAVGGGQPGRSGEARIIDLETGAMRLSLARSDDCVFAARFDPAGERLAVASADTTVSIFQVETGQLLHTLTSHADWVTALDWSSDGKLLATASRDKTAKVFDATTGTSLITFSAHNAAVRGVAFLPDNKRVYSIGGDSRLRRWKISGGSQEKETKLGGDPYGLVSAGEWLMIPASDRIMYGAMNDSGDVKLTYEGLGDALLSAAYHAGTKQVAAGSMNGRVMVWNAENTVKQCEFLALPGYVP